MRADLVFFGHRLDMASRARRRTLVVLLYGSIAALMAVLWITTHWRGTGYFIIYAALFACYFFFGGSYARGLVKPFNGRGPRQADTPPSLLALKLRVYQPVFSDNPDAAYRNDERELHQRDRAHYIAYQVLGVLVSVILFIASLRATYAGFRAWLPISSDELYYGLTLFAVVLFLTLPQAILLWTEPDMEPAPE